MGFKITLWLIKGWTKYRRDQQLQSSPRKLDEESWTEQLGLIKSNEMSHEENTQYYMYAPEPGHHIQVKEVGMNKTNSLR